MLGTEIFAPNNRHVTYLTGAGEQRSYHCPDNMIELLYGAEKEIDGGFAEHLDGRWKSYLCSM